MYFLGGGLGWGACQAHPLNCCRPACSFSGLQSNMVLGRGAGWGDDKHIRSTLLPDYKITWLWGGGGGKNGEKGGPEGKPVDGCLLWFLCSSQTY